MEKGSFGLVESNQGKRICLILRRAKIATYSSETERGRLGRGLAVETGDAVLYRVRAPLADRRLGPVQDESQALGCACLGRPTDLGKPDNAAVCERRRHCPTAAVREHSTSGQVPSAQSPFARLASIYYARNYETQTLENVNRGCPQRQRGEQLRPVHQPAQRCGPQRLVGYHNRVAGIHFKTVELSLE